MDWYRDTFYCFYVMDNRNTICRCTDDWTGEFGGRICNIK